jgi:hypothetical protein
LIDDRVLTFKYNLFTKTYFRASGYITVPR